MADNITKETFTVNLTYEMTVNTETGEILETKLVDRTVDKSDLKKERPVIKKEKPQDNAKSSLVLEENKYVLNESAMQLMHLEAGDKIDIKYEDGKSGSFPVIGTDEAFGTKGGNKLTKSRTVAFRGNKNEELSKYGKEFEIIPHYEKEGLFILKSNSVQIDKPELKGDDNIQIDEDDVKFDFNLDELIDDEDANIKEVDSNFFQL